MSGAEQGPPSEVWRGVDAASEPIAVAMTEGRPKSWYVDLTGKWAPCEAIDIYRAWAMAERARADAATREADRLRHGVAIEVDYVCPDALRADAADADAARLLAERADVVRLLGAPPDADVRMAAKNAIARAERAEGTS